MNRLSLIRTASTTTQTLGRLSVIDPQGKTIFSCVTLELPWLNNQRRISCIPPGTYRIRPRVSQKYGLHLHILNVPNRDWILIHEANFVHQLQGCIAVGQTIADLNRDGVPDITSSKLTKARLMEFINGETEITIR
jgi:hypothetical protein